jgi:hypothetical protein
LVCTLQHLQINSYQFKNNFLRIEDYDGYADLFEVFPHLESLLNGERKLESMGDEICFVIRSSNEDDVHKVGKRAWEK